MSRENTVYVGKLAYAASESDVQYVFEKYGPIAEVKVVKDRETGRSRGFAFVEFENSADASSAVEGLVNYEIKGMPINVSIARPRQERSGGGGGGYGGGGGGRGGRGGGGGGGFGQQRSYGGYSSGGGGGRSYSGGGGSGGGGGDRYGGGGGGGGGGGNRNYRN